MNQESNNKIKVAYQESIQLIANKRLIIFSKILFHGVKHSKIFKKCVEYNVDYGIIL
jgi:hypothetical protein